MCSPFLHHSWGHSPHRCTDDHHVRGVCRALQHHAPGGHAVGWCGQGCRHAAHHRPRPPGPDTDWEGLPGLLLCYHGGPTHGHAAGPWRDEEAPGEAQAVCVWVCLCQSVSLHPSVSPPAIENSLKCRVPRWPSFQRWPLFWPLSVFSWRSGAWQASCLVVVLKSLPVLWERVAAWLRLSLIPLNHRTRKDCTFLLLISHYTLSFLWHFPSMCLRLPFYSLLSP